MPGLTAKKIRDLTPTEREKKLSELRTELTKIRAQTLSGSPGKASKIGNIRRTIARILTVVHEEENALEEAGVKE
ncbi:MAG: 50S ribosomal protein L29, partial [Candidatus Ranarchaeia archaeon]